MSSQEVSPVDSTGVREPRLRGYDHSVESRVSINTGSVGNYRSHAKLRGDEMRRRYLRKNLSSDTIGGADLTVIESQQKLAGRLPLREKKDIYFP